jgi:hypothetical protein
MKQTLCNSILNVIADLNVDYNEAKLSIMLLSLLSNYNKYEAKNAVLTQLITTRDPGPLEVSINNMFCYLNLTETLLG